MASSGELQGQFAAMQASIDSMSIAENQARREGNSALADDLAAQKLDFQNKANSLRGNIQDSSETERRDAQKSEAPNTENQTESLKFLDDIPYENKQKDKS